MTVVKTFHGQSLDEVTHKCQKVALELLSDPEFTQGLPRVFTTVMPTPKGPIMALGTYGLTTRMQFEVGVVVNTGLLEADRNQQLSELGAIQVAELIGNFLESQIGKNPEENTTEPGSYVIKNDHCRVRMVTQTLDELIETLENLLNADIDREGLFRAMLPMPKALYRGEDFPLVFFKVTHIHFGDYTCEESVEFLEKRAAAHPWTH